MSDAALALREAVHARLTSDAELSGLLGGARLHDEPPRAATGPYLVFARWETDDASAAERRMTSHGFDIAVWGAQGAGTARSLAIGARIEALLHDATLPLAGHALVFLYWDSSATTRDERSKLPRLTLSFRALTEAL